MLCQITVSLKTIICDTEISKTYSCSACKSLLVSSEMLEENCRMLSLKLQCHYTGPLSLKTLQCKCVIEGFKVKNFKDISMLSV